MPHVISTGDIQSPRPVIEPDAHGQAALLLIESLIHMLVDKATLTNIDAVEVIQVAQEVKVQVATLDGESARRIQESLALLNRISATFDVDK